MRAVAVVFLALLTTGPSARAADEGSAKATAGPWLLGRDDGSKGCVLTLTTETSIGGYALKGQDGCTGTVRGLAQAMSWNFDDDRGLYFLDALRKKIVTVVENEDATWTERREAGAKLWMTRAGPGVDRLPTPSGIFGTHDMVRPNGPTLCSVTFLKTPPPGGEESFALTLAPGCDKAVTGLKLASWRVEGPYLMLYGPDGQSLQFVPTLKGFAKSEVERGKPLDLLKRK